MKRRLVLICCVLALMLSANPLGAKGLPHEITITGPGIARAIVVRDPDRLEWLVAARLMVLSDSIPVPMHTRTGYTLVRDDWDKARYYPDLSGGTGYIYYVGLINGWSEYDGRWFAATPEGDAVMRALLAEAGITFTAEGYHLPPEMRVWPVLAFRLYQPF